jgi:hypothetical protein
MKIAMLFIMKRMTKVNVCQERTCTLSQDRIVEKLENRQADRRDNYAKALSKSGQGDQ